MEPATPPAIHRAERERLLELLDRFTAGGISVWRFEWQAYGHGRSADRGVAAIAGTWCDCDASVLFGWCTGVRSLPHDQQAMLERCRLFLYADLPYEWPDPPNLALADLGQAILVLVGMTAIGNFLFGVVILFLGLWLDGIGLLVICAGAGAGSVIGYRALKRWKREQWADCTAVGDVDVWPFLRRADYARALRTMASQDRDIPGR